MEDSTSIQGSRNSHWEGENHQDRESRLGKKIQ
jgi:hypothetical protein